MGMTRKARHRMQQKSFKNLMLQTNSLRQESFLTDVKLICEDMEFFVHRIILSAASPYFKQQFQNNPDTKALNIDFTHSKLLEIVLKFIYQGRIDVSKETTAILKELVEAFRILQIPLMYNYCLKLLLNSNTPEQLLSQWKTVDELNSRSVKQTYLEYLHRNIGILSTKEGFLKLTFEQITSLLSCPLVNPDNQMEIVNAILNWVKFDEPQRENRITYLLKSVNFEKLCRSYMLRLLDESLLQENLFFHQQFANSFRSELNPNQSIKSLTSVNSRKENRDVESLSTASSKVKKISEKAKKSHLDIKTAKKGPEIIAKQKTGEDPNKVNSDASVSYERASVIPRRILCYNYHNCNRILEFNIHSKSWSEVNDQLLLSAFSRTQHSAICSFDNFIYFFGGEIGEGQKTNRCFMLDLLQRKYLEIKPMCESRSYGKAVKFHDYIYVIGGRPEANQRYNLSTQSWEYRSPIPQLYSKDLPAVIAVDKHLCLVGHTNLIWFNPLLNQWYEGNRLPEWSFDTVAVTERQGKLFLLGLTTNYIVVYDLKDKYWDSYLLPNKVGFYNDFIILSDSGKLEFLITQSQKSFIYSVPSYKDFISPVPFRCPILVNVGK